MSPWDEVSGNYPPSTRSHLLELMEGWRPSDSGGRLILWQGDPGTGKSYALRALAGQWRSWCDFHYITDPEAFFGRSQYMTRMMLSASDDDEMWPSPSEGDERAERWSLLILEDTGELLASDAKKRTGQGLSRLLNVADGLIGQGLRLLILVTTNEEMGALHPAITRPGRCLFNIRFAHFSPTEAKEWLAARDHHTETRFASATLSQLFALMEGREATEAGRQIGFVA